MATSVRPRPLADAATSRAVVSIAYAAGAVLLAAVAAVHVQQFADLFYGVSWIGPLFIALAAGCVLVIAGLAYPPTRRLAALAGVAVSARSSSTRPGRRYTCFRKTRGTRARAPARVRLRGRPCWRPASRSWDAVLWRRWWARSRDRTVSRR